MFTTPCFIRKNTPELCKKLERLGYEPSLKVNDDEGLCIATAATINFSKYVLIPEELFDSVNPHVTWNCIGRIDCGINEELFLAIAALRDDSDKNQWFVTEKEKHWVQWFVTEKEKYWVNQGTFMPIGSFIFSYVDNYSKYDKEVHKASVEELIQYFKNE